MLLKIEFLKLWLKPRTYIGFAGMAAVIGLVMVGMKFGHPFRHVEATLEERGFIVAGSFLNAEFVVHHLIRAVVMLFLPLFCAMVFGDLIASEAADGTMRTMLCRPVSRIGVGIAKYLSGVGYVLALTFGTGVAAFLVGWLIFGRGNLVSIENGMWIFTEREAIPKLLAAYGLAAISALAVGSIAFAMSSFLTNASGAIIGAMVVLYGLRIISLIDYFEPIKPYLFTSYLDSWEGLFITPVVMGEIWRAVGVMAAYSAVFCALGLLIFRRKDVLT